MGVIEGGWEYVIAAYSITWMALAFYIVSLVMRSRGGP